MTTYRTDIEKALDEMISNEEGMRFQGLSVILARLKWPEFIASERHNDLGLDAYAPASCANANYEKGLVCSITATIDKIKGDIKRFQPHYPNVKSLIFATPHKVTNKQAESWKEIIGKACSIELQIISREDIITDLMLPDNKSICASHLNIHVAVELTAQELIRKAREASGEILAAWLAHPQLAGKPKIELQSINLDKDGREIGEVFSSTYLSQALKEGRRIVLEAPAGRGKTTTLLQLAGCMDQLTFLIDLPLWIKSNNDILEFICKMPQFLSRGIDATALAQIYNAVPCSFLLNGWNEISDIYSDKAVSALSSLERNFSKAGVIVATRTHHINPPLPGSSRVRLLSFNRRQRLEYLNKALPARVKELIPQLENNRVLDDLTRTPLILSEVVNIFLSGATIPKTKAGILDAVAQLAEKSEEHRASLERAPLLGKTRDYLVYLAIQMTKDGTVTVEEEHARSVVSSVSRKLQDEGQIATLPEPAEVLSVLCAHHMLERLEYPSVTFRFQHQQFQEWYVSTVLRKYLFELISQNNKEKNLNFIREYINMPLWEEPLRMIAEDIGGPNADSSDDQTPVKAGSMLVEFALDVDPVFAAELARLCGDKVWAEVKSKVGQRLRSWYQMEDDSHKRCAIAGMIASGSEDFKDILLSFLTSDDQQVRLKTYRSFREFYASIIGEDWKQIIKAWDDELRADFIGEIVHERYMADIAEEFARVDSSPKVRAVALGSLEWTGATEALNRVLNSYNDDILKEVLSKRILHEIPQEARPRAITIYEVLLQKTDDPKERIRILLSIAEAGGEVKNEVIKEELVKWPSVKIDDGEYLLLKAVIELVQRSEPDWVSCWIAERVIKGILWSDRWTTFISILPNDFKRKLFKKISEDPLEYRDKSSIISILVATSDSNLAGDIFSQLCLLWDETLGSSGKIAERQWDIIRQLQELFRAIPSDIAIAGMLNRLSSMLNSVELQVAIELLGRIGDTGSDLKSELADSLRQPLRTYLKGGVPFILTQEDFNGSLKSELSTALARVGDPEDMVDLNKLIKADIERAKRGREAWCKGDRGPMGNGGVMSYSNWHIRAVECLDSQGAEDILLSVLCETEYEQDAAKALIRLAMINNPEAQHVFKKINYQVLWEARSGRLKSNFDEDRRYRYASAIKQRIAVIKKQCSQSDNPDSFNGRLKMLANFMAVLDSRESSDLIMEIMTLPGKWDGHARVEAIEALLFNGVIVKTDEALKVLNPTIEHAIRDFHDQQSRYLLQRCLCLLPFLNPSSSGIVRVKEVIAKTQFPIYDLREILAALGNSRCDEALDFLLELPSMYRNGFNHIRSEWIDAIAAIDTERSRKILMSFVDSEIEGFRDQNMDFDYHESDNLSSLIVDIACKDSIVKDRLFLLCAKQLAPKSRLLLANIVSRLGTLESMYAGLNLINDRKNPSIPYQLLRGLEDVFLRKRPYGGSECAYTIEAAGANEVRNHLYEMVIGDNTRKHSAYGLLGRIESWRLEYGRPDSEPRHPEFDSGKPWPLIELRDKSSISIIV